MDTLENTSSLGVCTAFDDYLSGRTGCYEYREVRYMAAGNALTDLSADDTVFDIGAGWTEFDYTLRTRFDWRGRYIPVDGGINGVDLNYWVPERRADFAVCLEILEHLWDPSRLVKALQRKVDHRIIVSVPNPRTVDVLGIDDTHVTIVTRDMLESWGFTTEERMFYGGRFSNGEPDSIFGVWEK